MHKELELMFLDDRRQIHLGELVHKNVYYDMPQSLTKYLTRVSEVESRVTRYSNKGNLVVPHCRTVAGGKAIGIRGPVFWNSLDKNIKSTEDFKQFARLIRGKLDQTYDNHPT